MARTLTLLHRQSPLAAPPAQLETLRQLPLAREFDDLVSARGTAPLAATSIATLQINVGKLCNQTCRHCHVDAGPDRREVMARETMALCIDAVARHQVEVVGSLPHYRAPQTDAQRGDGVFDKSIEALRRLNAAGYADGDSGLRLVLVTNPVGAYLPARQASLEAEWKREMLRRYSIRFDALFCITNMPISRFLEWLIASGNLEGYMARLVAAFNPSTVDGLMCRTLLSVGWDGRLYDCDFNQMLELTVNGGSPRHIRDFDLEVLRRRQIVTGRHCFGCTAGAGSSCGGTIAP